MIAIEATRMDKLPSLQIADTRNQAVRRESAPRSSDGQPLKIKPKTVPRVDGQLSESLRQMREQRENTSVTEELNSELTHLNDYLEQHANRRLSFFVDDETGKQGVRVIDAQTEEVVKQIPPEEILEIAKRLKEQLGILLDEVI